MLLPEQVDKRDRHYKKLPSTVGHDGISTLPRADRAAAKRKQQIIEQVGAWSTLACMAAVGSRASILQQ